MVCMINMQYLVMFLISLLLVAGQALWKMATGLEKVEFTRHFFFGGGFARVFFSGYFLFGALLYVFSVLAYLWALSRFPYYLVQTLVISSSLVLATLVARFVFHEKILAVNFLGIALIIIAVSLVARR